MNFEPKIEFPIELKKPGSNYEWKPFRKDGFFLCPSHPDFKDRLYIAYDDHSHSYHFVNMGGMEPMGKLYTLPFTHWFTKPIDYERFRRTCEYPFKINNVKETLVCTHDKLEWISKACLVNPDKMPIIQKWYDDEDFYPVNFCHDFKYKIMLDMDGVLTDYDHWLDYNNARKENGKSNWGKLAKIGASFWSNMPWNLEGHKLYNMIIDYIKNRDYYNGGCVGIGIHSAIGMPCGKIGKHYWLEKNCPEITRDMVKLDNDGHFKYKTGAKDEILVDDRAENVETYQAAGFPAVLFTNAEETFANIIKIIEGKDEAKV